MDPAAVIREPLPVPKVGDDDDETQRLNDKECTAGAPSLMCIKHLCVFKLSESGQVHGNVALPCAVVAAAGAGLCRTQLCAKWRRFQIGSSFKVVEIHSPVMRRSRASFQRTLLFLKNSRKCDGCFSANVNK
jgi:hypothetical protein